MPQYDDDYYLLLRNTDERLPYLQPTPDTAATNFRSEAIPFGAKPLMFVNGIADMQKEQGIEPLKKLPDVLFSGTDLVVDDSIRQKLLSVDIPNLVLQPSIYIDEAERWHENYWYLTFTERFDCWDRDASDYAKDIPIQLGGEEFFQVYSFRLNDALVRRTPMRDRTLFKMGGVNPAPVVAHRSLVSVFKPSETPTLEVVSISEWEL
jgi:hypothetical protein